MEDVMLTNGRWYSTNKFKPCHEKSAFDVYTVEHDDEYRIKKECQL